jgi:hypothetical protein
MSPIRMGMSLASQSYCRYDLDLFNNQGETGGRLELPG